MDYKIKLIKIILSGHRFINPRYLGFIIVYDYSKDVDFCITCACTEISSTVSLVCKCYNLALGGENIE